MSPSRGTATGSFVPTRPGQPAAGLRPERRHLPRLELSRLAAPGGAVLISVPVETGPTLIAKQFLRRIAGWRGVPGYQQGEWYTARELCSMLLAGPATQIARPVYGIRADGTGGYHGHKGFNWMALQRRIATRMTIERVAFTPWAWLRGYANSQVWFHCRAIDRNGDSRH